jgi:hypothetical protein
VKSEPKAFASLSSGLLARKGAAKPAMRPQGFGQMGSGLDDLGWNDMGFEPPRPTVVSLEGGGAEPGHGPLINPAAALTPASPVHQQQAKIVERLATDDQGDEFDETAELVAEDTPPVAEVIAISRPAPVTPAPVTPAPTPAATPRPARAPRARSAPGSKGKAAFTLRLDPDRHLKLRLACVVGGKSAQQLVTQALDHLLGSMPELDDMASKAPERTAKKG